MTTTTKTAACNLLPLAANHAAAATANGMTAEQFAASLILRNHTKAIMADAQGKAAMAILADKTLAIAALTRIASIPEYESGCSDIHPADMIAAILA